MMSKTDLGSSKSGRRRITPTCIFGAIIACSFALGGVGCAFGRQTPATIGIYYQGETVTDFDGRTITLNSYNLPDETTIVLNVSLSVKNYSVGDSSKLIAHYQDYSSENLQFDDKVFETLNPGYDCNSHTDYSGEILLPFHIESDSKELLDERLECLSYTFGFFADKDNSGSEYRIYPKAIAK